MKKLIFEEIEKLINENVNFTDERLRFQQEVKNVNYYNYETFSTEHDSDIVESNVFVSWKVGFWLNRFGIENFIVEVDGVDGSFTIALYDKQSDELLQETQKNIKDFNWNFVIDDANLIKGGSLYVTELNFDFKNNTCTVNF